MIPCWREDTLKVCVTELLIYDMTSFLRTISILFLCTLMGCRENHAPSTIDLASDPIAKNILAILEREYVDKPDVEKMKEGALSGMLMALDTHSYYMNEEVYKGFTESTNGHFGGVGLEVVYTDGGLRILSPIDDTPASKAGLQPGDYISQVDGEPVSNVSYASILKKMHGAPGTPVELTILRGDLEPFTITLKREKVNVNPVKVIQQDGIGYIRISYFNDKTEKALQEAIKTLKNQPSPLGGVILDLRNNPGGILEQAIAVASMFLGTKNIVHVKGKDPQKDKILKGTGEDQLQDIPMVVLINGWSASASEIIAAALKDYKRAILVGKRTFGKGSVQSVFPLEGHGGVKITTARFYSPKNHPIQDSGVQPDIVVETQFPPATPLSSIPKSLISEDDAQLRRAVDILRGFMLFQNKLD